MDDKNEKGTTTPPSEKDTLDSNHHTGTIPNTVQPADDEASEAPPRKLKGIAWAVCCASIFASVFLYALDNTIVATIQPALIESLGHIEKLPWLSVTYQLGSFALDLTWGKLFAQFDGKVLFIVSVFIFEVGSAVCGAAPTIDALIIGRAICGAGGVGVYMGALNLLGVSTTKKERPIYISCMGIIWGSGTVLGPVIGGAFADSSATWRWAFYINLIIGAIAAPAYILLPSTNADRRQEKPLERLRNIDWVGTVLICGATVSGFMAVNFGGALYSWNSGQIIGCFVCSGVLWILFGLQQSYAIFTTREHRLLPCDMILNLDANILFAQTAAGMGTTFTVIYYIPLYFQFVQNDTALAGGLRLLPMIFLMIFGSILNGWMLSKYGYFKPWAFSGGLLVVIGAALMYSLVGVDTSAAPIYGFTVILAFGAGLFTQGPISVVQSMVPPDRIADATAFVGFGQIGGSAIMLSIAYSVFINTATNGIRAVLPTAPLSQVQATIAGVGSQLFDSLDETTRNTVLGIIVRSINDSYILIMVAGALTVVTSIFMERKKRGHE